MSGPPLPGTRERLGDWEADTIIGREKKGGIISLVERRSRYCLLQKVMTKSAQTVAEAICASLLPVKDGLSRIFEIDARAFARVKIAYQVSGIRIFRGIRRSHERGSGCLDACTTTCIGTERRSGFPKAN
ncbi:MAG: hypothetical protein WKF92_09460 [Pyrinomonadaceae bacterium]